MKILGRSLGSEKSGFVVVMPAKHSRLERAVPRQPLVVEQCTNIVGSVKAVDPMLPAQLPVVPPAVRQLVLRKESHSLARQRKIVSAANTGQKNRSQGASVVDESSVVGRVAETDLILGFEGPVEAQNHKACCGRSHRACLLIPKHLAHLKQSRRTKVGSDHVRGEGVEP